MFPDEASIRDQAKKGTGMKVVGVQGNLMYLEGHPFPWRGIPYPNAVLAANEIKKALKWGGLKTIPTTKMRMFVLAPEYQQPITHELSEFLSHFTPKHEEIAHVIEFDAAYRLRLQDLLSETSDTMLLMQPIRELWRLMRVYKKREQIPDVYRKVRAGALLLTAALLWPPFKRKWCAGLVRSNFANFLPTEADKYWLSIRADYKAGV